jgi:hypothetical protein
MDVVRTGISQGSISDREVLDALELLLSLQRQVPSTTSSPCAFAITTELHPVGEPRAG